MSGREESWKAFGPTLPSLARGHQGNVCVWGWGSVWSHGSLLPCVLLTALILPGFRQCGGSCSPGRGQRSALKGVTPELRLNREWLISSSDGLRGLAAFPVKCTWSWYFTAWSWSNLTDNYHKKMGTMWKWFILIDSIAQIHCNWNARLSSEGM